MANPGIFSNGPRCRRKDITDLFLGTGLGPRSYAIIETGMISADRRGPPGKNCVDSWRRPPASRANKERRRETENRIRHTRENLERLKDLRRGSQQAARKTQSPGQGGRALPQAQETLPPGRSPADRACAGVSCSRAKKREAQTLKEVENRLQEAAVTATHGRKGTRIPAPGPARSLRQGSQDPG